MLMRRDSWTTWRHKVTRYYDLSWKGVLRTIPRRPRPSHRSVPAADVAVPVLALRDVVGQTSDIGKTPLPFAGRNGRSATLLVALMSKASVTL